MASGGVDYLIQPHLKFTILNTVYTGINLGWTGWTSG